MMTNIEGCRRWPSQDTLAKLATALNVDIEQLFAAELETTQKNHDMRNEIKKGVISELQQTLEKMK